jgi:hypothetical protein
LTANEIKDTLNPIWKIHFKMNQLKAKAKPACLKQKATRDKTESQKYTRSSKM